VNVVLTGDDEDEEEEALAETKPPVTPHEKAAEGLDNDEEEEEEVTKRKTNVTPLQLKLNRLAGYIAKLGAAAGLILFASLMIRFFTQLGEPGRSAQDKAQGFINILIIAVTIVVVAVRKLILLWP
jgi:magnesium-transporting ATPase (P-type)